MLAGHHKLFGGMNADIAMVGLLITPIPVLQQSRQWASARSAGNKLMSSYCLQWPTVTLSRQVRPG